MITIRVTGKLADVKSMLQTFSTVVKTVEIVEEGLVAMDPILPSPPVDDPIIPPAPPLEEEPEDTGDPTEDSKAKKGKGKK